MLRKTLSLLSIIAVTQMVHSFAWATFIPEEDIRGKIIKYDARDANMTEAEFKEAINLVKGIYKPIVKLHGGNLRISARWTDDTPNASAMQFFGFWMVNMYGGLARNPEMTLDGFTMVICHELGHHLAGFPFTGAGFGGVWAANEGQSDYFASFACAPDLWDEDFALNATFRENAPTLVQEKCDSVWPTEEEQNLCYRINAAGASLARTLANLKDTSKPLFETPDSNIVSTTNSKHPDPQCRLDTTFSGSLCNQTFDSELIPGKKVSQGADSIEAETEAAMYSCSKLNSSEFGIRPPCWYKSRL